MSSMETHSKGNAVLLMVNLGTFQYDVHTSQKKNNRKSAASKYSLLLCFMLPLLSWFICFTISHLLRSYFNLCQFGDGKVIIFYYRSHIHLLALCGKIYFGWTYFCAYLVPFWSQIYILGILSQGHLSQQFVNFQLLFNCHLLFITLKKSITMALI